MVSERYAIAMTEFLHYIKIFDDSVIEKIPSKMMLLFEENCDKDYICNFDYNKPLKELQLREETQSLINMVCYKYWCENDEERKLLEDKWRENGIKKEEEAREKYNPDNIFKQDEEKIMESQEVPKENMLIEVDKNKSFFRKIIDFIKGIFNR